MLLASASYNYIILFAVVIIISYFFDLYAKKSGVPAVLMLIGLGIVINIGLNANDIPKPEYILILEPIGIIGLILIVLEAALDLKLLREKVGLIFSSLFVALFGFLLTSYLSSLALIYILDVDLLTSLIYAIPLSILSSAIVLPSVISLPEEKKEFMIYESTFSDIIGIVGFYAVLAMIESPTNSQMYGKIFGGLFVTVFISVILSYALVYVFQNIKGHGKLFLLMSVLFLLYSLGKKQELSSLIIILVFGVILNNYKVFFKGVFYDLLNTERVEGILTDLKVITTETAFVVRTFFFIIFGMSVLLEDLLSLRAVGIGIVLFLIIYFIRLLLLFLTKGIKLFPEVFIAPRGLITVLLFFSIPEELNEYINGDNFRFEGVLLFIILLSCIIMSVSLISYKKRKQTSVINESVNNVEISQNSSDIDVSFKEEDSIFNKKQQDEERTIE